MSVLIETTVGELVIDLFTDQRPKSCYNFLKLCKMKYYNFSLFHSVQCNFIAQAGIPVTEPDTGVGYFTSFESGDHKKKYFRQEEVPVIKHTHKGMVSFAYHPGNCHGSQFFITLNNNVKSLDGRHTVFGIVAEGFDVLDKLNSTICDTKYRPYQDIRICHTIVLDDPYPEPHINYPSSPEPTPRLLIPLRIGAEDDIEEFKGLTQEQIDKILEDKELETGTKILELVGDIPDADLKPPENVLFVCKLNPDTLEKDLRIIFSRFGNILSCEIIKDQRTGESLQYGFIEFEKVEACEQAYLKMDNVLIDDRRIHVDFCQSIHRSRWNKSKLNKRYRLEERSDGSSYSSGESPPAKKHRDRDSHSPSYESKRSPRRHDTPSVRSFRR